ncbi:RNA polymerase sigma factor [Blastomonas sp. SL216]|uniref:RNA polymerase sigma factor n=1 Tax=Blastomonas sp. SL216 TaxID=2995169 RepID=UPI002377541B|nr:RNA polymerase subunit sigma-24 [Blastomonas sp. SL216]
MTTDGLGAAIIAARPVIVAALAARFRDLDLAEDGFADAAELAMRHFAAAPLPANLPGWLHVAGRRRIIDRLRRDARLARIIAEQPDAPEGAEMDVISLFDAQIPDERLRLIFICCHPAIAPEARAALTLRTVCGVPTERIAAAFLMAGPAMFQRLTRAKAKIREAGVPFETPPPHLWSERLQSVLATLEIAYALAFQDAAGSEPTADLGPDVLRLAAMLAELLPDDPEVLGLAALVQLGEARRAARVDGEGRMIPLSEQDVRLWDGALIASSAGLMQRSADLGRSGPYQLMAAIHLTHARRRTEGRTDCHAILKLYDLLLVLRPGPVVAINRAIALARVEGPHAGLAALDALQGAAVERYRPWHAARAHLLAQTGDRAGAESAFAHALALNPARAERLYLEARLRETSA